MITLKIEIRLISKSEVFLSETSLEEFRQGCFPINALYPTF